MLTSLEPNPLKCYYALKRLNAVTAQDVKLGFVKLISAVTTSQS